MNLISADPSPLGHADRHRRDRPAAGRQLSGRYAAKTGAGSDRHAYLADCAVGGSAAVVITFRSAAAGRAHEGATAACPLELGIAN